MTSPTQGSGSPDTKICPFCAEEIKAAAVKCRYCQSDLEDTTTEPPPPPETAPPASSASSAEVEPRRSLRSRLPRLRPRTRTTRSVPLRALARPLPVVVLSLLTVGLLVANVLLLLRWDGLRDASQARATGQVEAVNHVEKILSYSSKSFDKGTAVAEKLMTPKFRKQYAETVKVVREDATATKAVVKADVVASSVVSAKGDRVEALLFVNQTTTSSKLEQPRIDLNRVVVTLVPDDDGGWLVDNLQAL